MVVIKRILCPVDFSVVSERALVHAAAFALWHRAALTTLFVSPATDGPVPAGQTDAGQFDEQKLTAFFPAAAGASGAVRPRVTRGSVVTEILRVAAEMPADLIIMGTHGTSGFKRLVLGSVTEKVLRSSLCPVVTVPPGVNHHAAEPVAFRTVLCAVDFSDSSTRALEYAVALARRAGGGLVLLHVLEWFAEEREEPIAGSDETTIPTSEQDARAQLEALLTSDARACDPELIVGYGAAHAEVLRLVRERQVDLVVLGVQGRNVLDRTLFGSTTQRVVRDASCLVLTVRNLGKP
jgi:nucleotide-binding universal stress UspA family protein